MEVEAVPREGERILWVSEDHSGAIKPGSEFEVTDVTHHLGASDPKHNSVVVGAHILSCQACGCVSDEKKGKA